MTAKLIAILALLSLNQCNKPKIDTKTVGGGTSPTINAPINIWTTSADASALLTPSVLNFTPVKDDKIPVITVDSTQKYQTIDGFGYTLTGGSGRDKFVLGNSHGAYYVGSGNNDYAKITDFNILLRTN